MTTFHFTTHASPEIDARILSDLAIIRELLVDALPSITALLLVGGFGRGEGSVLVSDQGIQPVNDYDILVIHAGTLERSKLIALRAKLLEQIDIWLLDLLPLPESSLAHLPLTQLYFDSANGYYQFYGAASIAQSFPRWDARDLPLAQAKKILFNRFISTLEAYREPFSAESSPSVAFKLANQCSKSLLACCDARLMCAHAYTVQYQQRPHAFRHTFPDEHKLADLIEQAANLKLQPQLPPTIDVVAYWRETVAAHTATVKQFIPIFYDTAFTSWAAFARYYLYPWRDNRWRDWATDSIRLLLRRTPVLWQIRNLELAALFTMLAVTEPTYLPMAIRHLNRAGSSADSWESCRPAVVERWYTIKHT